MRYLDNVLSHYIKPKERDIKYVHDLWLRAKERNQKYRDAISDTIDEIIENVEPNENGVHVIYDEPDPDNAGYITTIEIGKSDFYDGYYRSYGSSVNMENRDSKLDYAINFEKTEHYAKKLRYYDKMGGRCVSIVYTRLISMLNDIIRDMIGNDGTNEIFLRSFVISIGEYKYMVNVNGHGNTYKSVESIDPYMELDLMDKKYKLG